MRKEGCLEMIRRVQKQEKRGLQATKTSQKLQSRQALNAIVLQIQKLHLLHRQHNNNILECPFVEEESPQQNLQWIRTFFPFSLIENNNQQIVEADYCAQHDQFFLFLCTSLSARSSKRRSCCCH